jgi:hypothetical protein
MAQDKEFINGLNFKPPREQAPEFVKGTGSINKNRLIEFLQSKQDEWVNFNVMVGRSGNWYAEVDNWKPDTTKAAAPQPAKEGDDDLPW